MINTAFWSAAIFFVVFSFFAKRSYIHILQLNSYRPERYLKWFSENKGKIVCARGVFPLLSLLIFPFSKEWAFFLMAALFLIGAPYKKKKAKKALVYTARVKRLMVAGVLTDAIIVWVAWAFGLWFIMPIAALFSGWLVMAAYYIMCPVEKCISNYYIRDAKRILAEHKDLTVIGITGSYGKTSMKYALTSILEESCDVLMTPGSFNTTMGVVRTVRESLKSTHKIFVVEMGAKNKGDIKEICDLVHPNYGIITSVGPQHLETFKTVENVCDTKFELFDAVTKNGGKMFLNTDNEYIKEYIVKKGIKSGYVGYGAHDGADFLAKEIKSSASGREFSVNGAIFSTTLLGDYAPVNIAGAYAAASLMGVTEADARAAVRRMKAPEHRLELKKNPRYTVIDDAYNSNPAGAAAALSALARFEEQKILVTPGMVELGTEQDRLNTEFGKKAAHAADVIVLVGEKQAPPIKEGVLSEGFSPDKLYVAKDINDALAYVYKITDIPSVVLLENDLPDNFL